METLKAFYKTVKPWGFWKPVLNEVQKQDPSIRTQSVFFQRFIQCLNWNHLANDTGRLAHISTHKKMGWLADQSCRIFCLYPAFKTVLVQTFKERAL